MKIKTDLYKAIFSIGVGIFILVAAFRPAMAAEMDNYCSTPPFLSNVVPPNVLIVLDNSGSMHYQAYPGSYNPTQFNRTDSNGIFVAGHYYGYFDPTQNYTYDSVNNKWVVTAAAFSTATPANPIANGDLLNWATMRRVEVAKKLLIGGKANPRVASGTTTVKLYAENSPSSDDFSNSYDNTSTPGIIAPFSDNYNYTMQGDQLTVTPQTSGATTRLTYPISNISVPVAWTITGGGAAWQAVDEVTSDGDTTTIQNKSTTTPALLGYNYTGLTTDTITQISIKVVAKKSNSTTMKIQGVLKSGGSNYASTTQSLTTSYSTYTFAWSTNPATGNGWLWSEINGALSGFGVQANSTPTSSSFPVITQIYLQISTANSTGGPYSVVVDQGTTSAAGLLDNLSSSARFGLMFYNQGCGIECGSSTGDGGAVNTYVDFNSGPAIITSISNMNPQTWTPLAETLYEAIKYFRQDAPYYNNSPADYVVSAANDPYYYKFTTLAGSTLANQYVPCAKSFVLFLTDGEATMDTNIPTTIKDFDNDGKDPAGVSSTDYATDYMDDVAFWGRTVDHRTLSGIQNVYLYTVFLFGQGSSLLSDAAINGGFNDLNGDGKPGPDIKEYLRDSNNDGVITAGPCPGATCDLPLTYFEGDDGYALETSITDAIASILKRAASGTAVSVLTTSSRGIGSLVQAYFLPSKQEGIREVTWTGYTQNIWIDPQDNLREDTVNDYSLKLDQDNVLKLYFDQNTNETKAATFTTDVSGNGGTLNSCSSPVVKEFSDVTYLWEAGKQLALRAPSTRTLFTSKNVIRGTATGTPPVTSIIYTSAATPTFDTSMSAALKNELNAGPAPAGDNVIRYIRGECIETTVTGDSPCGATANTTYRDRRINVSGGATNGNVWKLGDIISSTPKVLATTALNTYHIDYADTSYYSYITGNSSLFTLYPDKKYNQRSSISFMGANDGMVHAFRVGYLKDKNSPGLLAGVQALFKNFSSSPDTTNDRLGEEVWGYIPFNALPYLKHLANPNYCHLYFNDLSVKLVDASIGGSSSTSSDSKTVDSWRTILVGGMRFGAGCSGGGVNSPPAAILPTTSLNGFSSYFAIDITDPEIPVPMWEFSDFDMGYSTTFPAIVRTGDRNTNGRWYVAVGSGSTTLPKSTVDINRTTTGYVYFIDLKTGALAKKVPLDHNAIVGDILAIDQDKDYNSEEILFGTAYKSTTWKGKLVSIAIPVNQDLSLASWTPAIKYLFSDNYPFTASLDAAKDTDANVWVYGGSGKYYSDLDELDSAQQLFLGLKDVPSGITYPLTASALDNRTATTTTGTVTATRQACLYNSASNSFGFQTIVTAISPTSAAVAASTKGWYLNLSISPSAERVITRPLAVGGLVDFLSYQPNSDPCSYGGNSFLYAVGYTSGVAPTSVAIVDPKTTNGVTTGAVTVAKGVMLGPGAPPTGEAIIIPPPKEGEENLKKKIQVATGVIIEAENKPVTSVISKVVHWLKK